MMKLKLTMLALALTFTAACLKKNTAEPVKQTLVTPPADVVKAKVVEPSPPEVVSDATPDPAPETPAPEKKKKKKKAMPLGLPNATFLKNEVGLDGKQLREIKKMYGGYKDQIDEAAKKIRSATDEDKKQARKDTTPLRKEILEKLAAIMTEEQNTAYQDFLKKRREANKAKQEAKQKK